MSSQYTNNSPGIHDGGKNREYTLQYNLGLWPLFRHGRTSTWMDGRIILVEPITTGTIDHDGYIPVHSNSGGSETEVYGGKAARAKCPPPEKPPVYIKRNFH